MTSRYLQFGLLLNACFSLEGEVGTNIFLHKFCPIMFSTCTLLFCNNNIHVASSSSFCLDLSNFYFIFQTESMTSSQIYETHCLYISQTLS